MHAGVVLLNFGEPEAPTRDQVVPYLERIFYSNADLEESDSERAARERARQLAERRAPGLLEEYEAIGGSPLVPNAEAQADRLADELAARGHEADTYVGMQFTDPLVESAVESAVADGVDRLVGLPVYPLCGPSTTVAALGELREAVDAADADLSLTELSGWHRHPDYTRLRADNVRSFLAEEGVDLLDSGTRLVCSAHGTPVHYLEEGSRYDRYVEEYCEALAAMLGVEEYALGYQNHENRDIPWTEPEVEDLLPEVDADRVVVEPVSFMHEQSETLHELDVELREEAAELGLEFHRVPVPHDHPEFADLLADLVEPFLAGFDPGYYQFRQCRCRDEPGTMCLNAPNPGFE